jgi:hypothetical protein
MAAAPAAGELRARRRTAEGGCDPVSPFGAQPGRLRYVFAAGELRARRRTAEGGCDPVLPFGAQPGRLRYVFAVPPAIAAGSWFQVLGSPPA